MISSKTQSSKTQSFIWAVDAFGETDIQEKGCKTLQIFAECQDQDTEIEAAFILTPEHVFLSPAYYPAWFEHYKKEASHSLKNFISNFDLPKNTIVTILENATASTRDSVEKLLVHAKNKKARLIVVSSHAHSGLSRFFLGSFAETLLLFSKIPVLVINPTTEVPKKFSHILFPTDFTHASEEGFEDTLILAKKFNAKVSVYHKTILPMVFSGEAPDFGFYLDAEEKIKKEAAHSWLEKAKRYGVKCQMEFDATPGIGSADKAVVDFAEKAKVDLICMVTQSSNLSATFLGSTTRYVVRNAHCPVWVEHS